MKEKSIQVLIIFIILSYIGLSFSCTKQTEKGVTQQEDKITDMQININACMKPLIAKGIDSLRAEDICRCGLETLIELDSNVYNMNTKELNWLFESNKEEIMNRCDEIKKLYQE